LYAAQVSTLPAAKHNVKNIPLKSLILGGVFVGYFICQFLISCLLIAKVHKSLNRNASKSDTYGYISTNTPISSTNTRIPLNKKGPEGPSL
ncbi:MAG: hypothetical protein K2G06_07690, partial [Muribaculaceae bacterium]|nr:hypothetical protein [Muribaculaceae bacterium]